MWLVNPLNQALMCLSSLCSVDKRCLCEVFELQIQDQIRDEDEMEVHRSFFDTSFCT